jgi:hypothetical protein
MSLSSFPLEVAIERVEFAVTQKSKLSWRLTMIELGGITKDGPLGSSEVRKILRMADYCDLMRLILQIFFLLLLSKKILKLLAPLMSIQSIFNPFWIDLQDLFKNDLFLY